MRWDGSYRGATVPSRPPFRARFGRFADRRALGDGHRRLRRSRPDGAEFALGLCRHSGGSGWHGGTPDHESDRSVRAAALTRELPASTDAPADGYPGHHDARARGAAWCGAVRRSGVQARTHPVAPPFGKNSHSKL